MDLATAQQIIDDQTHPDWLAAYKTIQWDTIWRADPHTLNAELVDWDEPDPVVPDDEDDDKDFTFRDAEVSGAYGCDETGAYYVEVRRSAG